MIQTTTEGKLRLCHLNDIAPGNTLDFRLETTGGTRLIFVVNYQGHYYAYVNSCPHTGASLEWEPNRFLDATGTLLQCSTHGALFRIEDGLCIHGPCLNRSLTRVETINDGQALWVQL